MVISERMNVVEGRYCDSWVRVIGGRLVLFVHRHTPTAGRSMRASMRTISVQAWEVPWSEFETIAQRARFTSSQQEGSILRHRWV